MGGSRKGWPVGPTDNRQFKHYLNGADLPKYRTLHGLLVLKWIQPVRGAIYDRAYIN